MFCFVILTRAQPPPIDAPLDEVIIVSAMKMESADHKGTVWAIKLTAHHS